MKRYIRFSTNGGPVAGFLFEFGNRAIFIKSNITKVTDKVVRCVINCLCDIKNVSDSIRQGALYNQDTLRDFRRRIAKATLEHVETPSVEYYRISGKDFTLNFPEDDFRRDVIIKEMGGQD